MYNVSFNQKLYVLSQPIVAGIINVSPDSFYKSEHDDESILANVASMLQQGATIIDMGGCSTRPDGQLVSEQVEWQRLKHALSLIVRIFPDLIISIDTFRANIAYKAVVEYGVAMVNDVMGGQADPTMFSVVGKLNVPYVLTHNESVDSAMSDNQFIAQVIDYFKSKICMLKSFGVKDIIIDPGFGFSKTLEQNYVLLRRLNDLKIFNLPILVGLSHKSMIYKVLNTDAADTDFGTVVLESIALQNGADIVRTHNVNPTIDAITLLQKLSLPV